MASTKKYRCIETHANGYVESMIRNADVASLWYKSAVAMLQNRGWVIVDSEGGDTDPTRITMFEYGNNMCSIECRCIG